MVIMPNYLPRWLLRRLIDLYEKFKAKEFSFEDSKTVLNDDSRVIAIILSELNKAGWIDIKPDPSSPRKRLYNLKHIDIIEKLRLIKIDTSKIKDKVSSALEEAY